MSLSLRWKKAFVYIFLCLFILLIACESESLIESHYQLEIKEIIGGGRIVNYSEGVTYPKGRGVSIDLKTEAEEGYKFYSWYGDVPENQLKNPTINLLMDDNKTVWAEFRETIKIISSKIGDGEITINWSAIDDVDNYRIRYSYNGEKKETDRIDSTDYTLSDLENGTRYYIEIFAYRGNEIIKSEEISVTPRVPLKVEIGNGIEHRGEELTIPVEFSDVPAEGISSVDFKIDFDTSAFKVVEVSPGEIILDTSDFNSIVNNEEGTIDFVFSSEDQIQSDGEFANISFEIQESCLFGPYEISASDIDAFTSLGREVEVKIIAGEIYVEPRGLIGPPPVPELISVEAGDGEVTVKWEPVRHATDYLIYIGTNPYIPTSLERARGGDASEYTVTGLTNDTTYYFSVASYSSEGRSELTDPLSATPSASEGLSAQTLE
ncbi:cohesin domain-containing protein [Natronospora cellulosivora (SeqCode)]